MRAALLQATLEQSQNAMREPTIAVVIPVHRQGHYLTEAVLTAAAQTISGIEIVIVDDGCPTRITPMIGRRLSDAFQNVTYLRTPNRGVAHARNYGARYALAAWPSIQAVFFLDSDDRLSPHTLETLWSALEQADGTVGWAYADYNYFGLHSGSWIIPLPFNAFRELFEGQSGAESLVHRRVFDAGIFYEESSDLTWEDWEFIVHASTMGFSGVHVEDAGIWYRIRGYSRLSHIAAERDRLHEKIARRHPETFDARARTRLEHTALPRYALVEDGDDDVWIFTDPLAPTKRQIPLDDYVATVRAYVTDYPRTTACVPPIVLIAVEGVRDALFSSNFGPAELFRMQQGVRDGRAAVLSVLGHDSIGPRDSALQADQDALIVGAALHDLVSMPGDGPNPFQEGAVVFDALDESMHVARGVPWPELLDRGRRLMPGRQLRPQGYWDPTPHTEFALQTAHSHKTTFPWAPWNRHRRSLDVALLVEGIDEGGATEDHALALAREVAMRDGDVRMHLLVADATAPLPDRVFASFTTVTPLQALAARDINESLLTIAQSFDWICDTGTTVGRTVLWYIHHERDARYGVFVPITSTARSTVEAAATVSSEDAAQTAGTGLDYLFSRYYEPLVDHLFVWSDEARRWCLNRGAPPPKVTSLAASRLEDTAARFVAVLRARA